MLQRTLGQALEHDAASSLGLEGVLPSIDLVADYVLRLRQEVADCWWDAVGATRALMAPGGEEGAVRALTAPGGKEGAVRARMAPGREEGAVTALTAPGAEEGEGGGVHQL